MKEASQMIHIIDILDLCIFLCFLSLPQLIEIVGRINVTSSTCVHEFSRFFWRLCRTFGKIFTNTKVKLTYLLYLNILLNCLIESTPKVFYVRFFFLTSLFLFIYEPLLYLHYNRGPLELYQ